MKTLYNGAHHCTASELAHILDNWISSCDTIAQLETCEQIALKWLETKPNSERHMQFIKGIAQTKRVIIQMLNEVL